MTDHQPGHWLLSAAPSIPQAHTEWQTAGAAWLLPGQWFTALVVPATTIHRAFLRWTPEECAAPLAEALDVTCSPAPGVA